MLRTISKRLNLIQVRSFNFNRTFASLHDDRVFQSSDAISRIGQENIQIDAPTYGILREQILETKEELTRDDKRALKRRTGPPNQTRKDKITPIIPIKEIKKDDSTKTMLSELKGSLYAICEIKQRAYYIKKYDDLIIPRLHQVGLGDEIIMDRIREIGGEKGLIKGNPFIHPSFFTVKATVIEHFFDKENITERKKKRGKNTIRSHRNNFTRLKITDISMNPN